MMSRNRWCAASPPGLIGIKVFKMLLAGIVFGLPGVAVGAGTFRFDHVEFESFKGGSTSVHALSNSGLAVGASGGIGVDSQTAFVSDQSGALQSIKGLALHHSIALVVNEAGQIAGRGCTSDELCVDAAFRASPALGAQIITGLPGKIGEVTTSTRTAMWSVRGFLIRTSSACARSCSPIRAACRSLAISAAAGAARARPMICNKWLGPLVTARCRMSMRSCGKTALPPG